MVRKMTNQDFYLLIDVGTGSSRVALMDENRKIYNIRHIENIYKKDKYGGMLIDFHLFLNNLADASRRVLEAFDVKITAITVSGARQTFFCLDKNKKVLFGIPNIDERGSRFLNKFAEQRKTILKKTARDIAPNFLTMKLASLREDRPDLYKEVFSFTSLSELFALLFCEKLVIEPTQAVETQLFNIFEKKWDKNLLKIFHLETFLLPEVVPSETIYPIKNNRLLRKFGIKNEDCQFVVGGGDTQLALKAILAESEHDKLGLVSGTTSPVCVRVNEPFVHSDHWLNLDLGGKDYVLEYNPGVTGLNYERAKKLLLPESSYKEIEEKVNLDAKQSIFASFTTQSFMQTGGGNRYGGFFFAPPVTDSVTKETLVGSIAFDIGFAITRKVLQLKDDVHLDFKSIVACGGGMNSVIIPQVVASLTNLPIRIYENFQEPSLIGCFKVIDSALGKNKKLKKDQLIFEYYPKKNSFLEESYKTWEQLNLNIIEN